MHCKDLRGVISVATGSFLMHLVLHYDSLGATQQARLDALNKDMKDFQTSQATRAPHPMPPLRLKDLKTDGWHDLSGPLIKAANTRCLVPWLRDLARRKMSPHGGYSRAVIKVFDALYEIEQIMYSSDMFLSDIQKSEFSAQFLIVGEAWMFLRSESRLARVDAWQIKYKCHAFLHLPSQADLINPRFVQVYAEESLMGKVTRVWKACARGPYAPTVQHSVLSRIWSGLEMRFTADL